MKIKLFDMTLKEVREGSPFEVAILPWGACEPHNLHLPYGCDTLAAEKISVISAEKAEKKGAKVIVLPAIPIGVNTNTLNFSMTLNLNPTTQLTILKDIIYCLEKHKINKMIIFNGHGGNDFKWMARELHEKTSVHIFVLNWWEIGQEFVDNVCDDKTGEHGNEAETSWFMYLYPDKVHLEWADEGQVKEPVLKSLKENNLWITRPWHLLTTNSGYGNPKRATAEKGKMIVEEITDRIAEIIKELSEAKITPT
ncbi:MAG: creatininase family protein, partial [Candidatus Omnitrophica bacterium]|nr:creatininase family protein [Candidatus Omnitrophota bacterium]